MAKLSFDANAFNGVEAPQENTILPAGEYTMQIVQSDLRTTKAGTGQYLWLEFDVVSGPCAPGRKFWDRLNIENPNEQTRKIALSQLLAISKAAGYAFPPSDSQELHFKPIKVVIKHKENKQGALEARAGYYSLSDTPKAAAAPAAPVAATTGAAPKPWERHKK